MNKRDPIDKVLRAVDTAAAEPEPAVDALRLLPGEDATSPYGEEAEHWEAVHEELEHFTESLLDERPQQQAKATRHGLSLDQSVDKQLFQANWQGCELTVAAGEQRRGGRGGLLPEDYLEQG